MKVPDQTVYSVVVMDANATSVSDIETHALKFITCKSIRSCCFCRPIKVNAMFSFSKACIFVVQEQCIAGRFALYSSKQFLWTSSCYSASKVTYLKTTEKVKLGLQNNGMFNDFLYLFVNLLLGR